MKAPATAVTLGVLVAANLGLFVAVDHHLTRPVARAAPTTQRTVEPSSATTSLAASPTSSAASTTSSSSPTSSRAPGPAVYVVARGQRTAWRVAGSAECGNAPKVQETSDGGVTWQKVTAPPAGGVTGARTDSAGHLVITGRTADGCRPTSWVLQDTTWTADATTTWSSTGDPGPDVLHNGKKVAACDSGSVLDTASTSSGLDVLCSTGDVLSVSSGSAASTTLFQSSDLLSIATEPDDTLVVARTSDGCDGVQLDEVSGGVTHSITCVKGAAAPVDLTFSGYYGWLVAPHNTWSGQLTGDWSKQ